MWKWILSVYHAKWNKFMFWLLSTILPKLLPAAAPLSCNIMCCVIIWITRSSFIWQGAVCRCAAGCGGNLGPTIARARVTQSRADTRHVLIPRANHSLAYAYDGWVICISFLFWQGFGLMSIYSGWAGSHQIHLVLPSSANVSESQIFPLSARQPLASSLASPGTRGRRQGSQIRSLNMPRVSVVFSTCDIGVQHWYTQYLCYLLLLFISEFKNLLSHHIKQMFKTGSLHLQLRCLSAILFIDRSF